MKIILLLISLLIFLQSCATSDRIKEKPNFNLTGADAQKEFDKFEMDIVSWSRGKFESEGAFTTFKTSEALPLMEEVSPKSVEMLKNNNTKEYISIGLFAAWIATSFIRKDGNISPLYWYGAGAALGYGFYLNYQREKVAEQFNEDLKSKFAPSLGYTFQY